MNKITIAEAFSKKAFIPFITAGDQGIDTTEKYIRTMAKAGASLIEIGIPFLILLQKVQSFKQLVSVHYPQGLLQMIFLRWFNDCVPVMMR